MRTLAQVLSSGRFGPCAHGDWGVGSDVDLAFIVRSSDRPFPSRPLAWPSPALPVPADMLVYTLDEWRALQARDLGLGRSIATEAVWVFGAPPAP